MNRSLFFSGMVLVSFGTIVQAIMPRVMPFESKPHTHIPSYGNAPASAPTSAPVSAPVSTSVPTPAITPLQVAAVPMSMPKPAIASSPKPVYAGGHQKKAHNFRTNITNVGYLYNKGTRRFLGKSGNNYIIAMDNSNNAMRVTIGVGWRNDIGTYLSIIGFDGINATIPGNINAMNDFSGAKRFNLWGHADKQKVTLYTSTSNDNRLIITPPYYKNETAFKIRIKNFCLAVDNKTYELIGGNCVDDNNGYPTEENDNQLFDFCMGTKIDACLGK